MCLEEISVIGTGNHSVTDSRQPHEHLPASNYRDIFFPGKVPRMNSFSPLNWTVPASAGVNFIPMRGLR